MNKNARIFIRFLTILFSLMTVAGSYYYSVTSGGTDLRNRTVGSRLMGRGYSPYFYKWHPADGERFLDPNDIPERLVNGNTVTPAVLTVMYPLSILDYPQIRFLWTTIELLAVLAIIWMMLNRFGGNSPLTAAAIVIMGLWAGDYWFMHVERGQIHIFYVLLFTSMYFIYTSKMKYAEFISGFIGGMFIFFRPFASMIVLGFLLQGKITWLKGWITGILTGLLIFVAPHPSLWKDYFKAMKEYGYECMKQAHFIPKPTSALYPPVIEGASNLTNIEKFNITSMPALHGVFRKLGINYTPLLSYLTCGLIFVVLSFLFFKQKDSPTAIQFFLFAFLTYLVEELFLLNWRTPYCVIEWMFPLFLIIQQINQRTVWLILLLTSLLFLHNFPFYFRYQVFTGELILLLMVFYFSISGPGANNLEIELQKSGK